MVDVCARTHICSEKVWLAVVIIYNVPMQCRSHVIERYESLASGTDWCVAFERDGCRVVRYGKDAW